MKFVVFVFLLYFSGVLGYLGGPSLLFAVFNIMLGVSIISFFMYLFKRRSTIVTLFVAIFGILYPVYAGIKSYMLFDQPIIMGIGALRYVDFIFLGYFLILIKYDYRLLLKQINSINITIALISIFLILILGINPGAIYAHEANNFALGGTQVYDSMGVGGENIRGIRFVGGSGLMFISLVYYQLAALKIGGKKNWYILGILLIYLLFVHKGRQPVALLSMIYAIYFIRMKHLSRKRMLMVVLPFVAIFIAIAIDPNIMLRFTTILDGKESKDFSTLARIWEIEQITPLIYQNPILGVGMLSAHWGTGGFQTFFGKAFYLADIGIVGAIATGGIVLIVTYIGIYVSLWNRTKKLLDNNIKEYMRYMLIAYAVLTIVFFNDALCANNSAKFAFIFFPLFASNSPDTLVSTIKSSSKYRFKFIA